MNEISKLRHVGRSCRRKDGPDKVTGRAVYTQDVKLPGTLIDRIVCPMGDKIGNNTPPEIAVGVLSQLVRLRQARFAQDHLGKKETTR